MPAPARRTWTRTSTFPFRSDREALMTARRPPDARDPGATLCRERVCARGGIFRPWDRTGAGRKGRLGQRAHQSMKFSTQHLKRYREIGRLLWKYGRSSVIKRRNEAE